MNPSIATLLFIIGILGLFLLDRDKTVKTSWGLWVAVIWVVIAGSRPISQWLGSGQAGAMKNAAEYLEGNPFDRTVFTGLLLLGLIVLARRGSKVLKLLRANWPIALFFAYCLASVLWSDYTDVSFKRWVKAFSDLVMVMIVLTEDNPLGAIKRLLARVGFLLVPWSILLIKYYPAWGRSYNIWTWEPSYVGVTDHKNTLGMVCMVLAIGFMWRFLLAYRDHENPLRMRRLLVHGTLLGMATWLFIQANSMTAKACFLLAAVFLIGTSLDFVARKRWLVQLMVFVLIAVPVCVLLLGVGGGALEEMGKDATLTGRTDIWRLVLAMAGNPVIGTGFESFWLGNRVDKMWSLYYFHPTQAHDGYIEVYLELGWVGILMLAGIVIAGYRNAMALLRTNPNEARIRMTFIAIALVYNVTEAGFRMMTLTWIFLLLSAMAVPDTVPETAAVPVPEESASRFEDWRQSPAPVPSLARRRREAV
jgi:exopolysaccharide production protein ExoQ